MIDRNTVLNMEDVKIVFRNFRGEERGQWNKAGDRNFSVVIEDEELAQQLIEDGWKVKIRKPKREDAEPFYHLPVKVSFKYPPKIVRIAGRHKTLLDENSVGCLDFDNISRVDIVIRPYMWDVNGSHGVAAYVKSMYVTVLEDVFASRYDEEFPED